MPVKLRAHAQISLIALVPWSPFYRGALTEDAVPHRAAHGRGAWAPAESLRFQAAALALPAFHRKFCWATSPNMTHLGLPDLEGAIPGPPFLTGAWLPWSEFHARPPPPSGTAALAS